ncbi:MAG: ABC transporter permease [Jatrophihabitans sp.]
MRPNVMRKVSLRNLAAHKIRLALTVISVVLGTAFIAGSFVFTDTLQTTFNKVFANAYKGVDVHVDSRESRGVGVPISLVSTLQSVPGVSKVQVEAGGPVVLIDRDGKPVHNGGAPSVGGIWYSPQETLGDVPTFKSGGPPTADNEIVINSGAAKKAHLGVGAKTKVLTPTAGLVDVTITGVYETDTETGGYVGVLFPKDEAIKLFTDGTHVLAVDLAGSGISQQQLRDRVAKTLPADLRAKTGDTIRQETKTIIQKALSFVNYFLLAFGFIALIVGTFIIYNTFSMIVAQRIRELALLRAIGADRGQIRRSVLFEAGVIGLVGSVLGVIGGIGLAIGLRALLNALNVGLPSGALDIRPRTVIVGILVGVVVTLISANAPSRRAATTPPVAAMRAEFANLGSSLRRRNVIGGVLAVIGTALAIWGALSTDAATAASLVGVSLLGVGAAVLLLSPALSQLIIGPLGRIVGRPFGTIGRLARSNAVRNPRRTAATAFALTLGLLLVAGVAVIGASAKGSINAAVDKGVSADYILTGTDGLPLPLPAAQSAQHVTGVGTFVELHPVDTTIDGKDSSGIGVDGDLAQVAPLKVVSGANAPSGATMIASKNTVKDKHWTLGQKLALKQPGGATVAVTLGGIFKDSGLFDSWMVSGDVFRQLTPAPRRTDIVALINAAPGTKLSTLRTDLEKATDSFYIVDVQDKEQFKGQEAAQVDGLLGILYGLLALAIVIAVLGIINTLALSVVERRREIGMLRAVGMVRGQLRRTIYLESLLIAVFGAILGVALGLAFGSLFAHSLRNKGLDHLEVPWAQAVTFVVVAGIVGVLAALWPAARAARIRPLEVIAES